MKKENHGKYKALGAVFLAIVMAVAMISINAFAMEKRKDVKDIYDPTVPETIFMTFNPNGGTGEMPQIGVNVNVANINVVTIPENEFTSPKGKEFDYWLYTDPNGGEHILYPGNEIEIYEDMELKAIWKDLSIVPGQAVMVTFNPNGGSGEMIPIELLPDSVLRLPENEFTSPEGKIFDHWLYVDGNNGEHKYYPGNDVTVYSNMEFLAVWKNVTPKRIVIKINPNGGILKEKYKKEKVVISPYSYSNPDAETYLKEVVTPPKGKTIEAVEFNGKRVPFSEKLTLKNDTEIKIIWKNIEIPEKVKPEKPEKPEPPKKEKSEKIIPKKKDIVKTSDDNAVLLALSVLAISFTGAITLMRKEKSVEKQ